MVRILPVLCCCHALWLFSATVQAQQPAAVPDKPAGTALAARPVPEPTRHTSSARPRLQWCLDHFPPRHSYQPGQQPQGPMVDMMQELAKRSGFELTFSPPTPINRCLKLLAQGKTDLMTGLLYSEQRAAFLHLLPFDEVRIASLFVRHDGPQLQSAADLQGKTVAMTQDRVYPASIFSALQQAGAQIIWGKDLDTALALLLYRQADYYAGPQHYTELLLQQNPRFAPLRRSDWQLPIDPIQKNYLGLSRHSRFVSLLPVLSTELRQMMAEGKTHFY